jgi:hypothetical protein
MIYLFSGNNYTATYAKAMEFIGSYNFSIYHIKIEKNNQKTESIEESLYYFFLSPANNPSILLIEHPEHLRDSITLPLITKFNSLPEKYILIFVTHKINLISGAILSNSICIHQKENPELDRYTIFIEQLLSSESLLNNTVEELLEELSITEEDTQNITDMLIHSFPAKNITAVRKNFLPYIKNSHIFYWKTIFLLLKN